MSLEAENASNKMDVNKHQLPNDNELLNDENINVNNTEENDDEHMEGPYEE